MIFFKFIFLLTEYLVLNFIPGKLMLYFILKTFVTWKLFIKKNMNIVSHYLFTVNKYSNLKNTLNEH